MPLYFKGLYNCDIASNLSRILLLRYTKLRPINVCNKDLANCTIHCVFYFHNVQYLSVGGWIIEV